MNMLLLVAAAGPETVIDVGKEAYEKTLVSGQETWARVTAQVSPCFGSLQVPPYLSRAFCCR